MTRESLAHSLERTIALIGSRSRPEASWVSEVVDCPLKRAEETVNEVSSHWETISAMSSRMKRTGKEYYAQFPAPIELYAFVRLIRPTRLVESGVSSGVSSTFLLLGAQANKRGMLHSIDFPAVRRGEQGYSMWGIPEGLASGWAVPRALRTRWDLRLGRSEDLLNPLLRSLGTVDLYCHDSPVDAGHFGFEMKAVSRYLKPGSLVVADNTDWGIFEKTARSLGAVAIRRRKSNLGAFRVPLSNRQGIST